MYFRLTRGIKHGFVDYFRRLFDLVDRDVIRLSDGREAIKFSRKPTARTYEEWEARAAGLDQATGQTRGLAGIDLRNREYPCVLINAVTGPMKELSFTTVQAPRIPTNPDGNEIRSMLGSGSFGGFMEIDESLDPNEAVFGGAAEFVLSFTAVARTREEADNLADMAGYFTAHPVFKALLMKKYGFVITDAPSFGSQSSTEDVATDFRLYQTELTIPVRGEWEDRLVRLDEIEAAFFSATLYDP